MTCIALDYDTNGNAEALSKSICTITILGKKKYKSTRVLVLLMTYGAKMELKLILCRSKIIIFMTWIHQMFRERGHISPFQVCTEPSNVFIAQHNMDLAMIGCNVRREWHHENAWT